jgi:hypothetical protein
MRLLKLLGAVIGATKTELPGNTEYEFDAIDTTLNARARGHCAPASRLHGLQHGESVVPGSPDPLIGSRDPDRGLGPSA